jgi:hypothetical protein
MKKTTLNEEVSNITTLIKKLTQNKKILIEQELDNSSVDNAKLVDNAKKDVEMINKSFNSYYNTIITLTISDIIENMEYHRDMLENLDTIYKTIENKTNNYFKIIESYDFFDRPNEINTLENLVQEMTDTSDSLRNIYYLLDNMLDATKDISKMKIKNIIKIN